MSTLSSAKQAFIKSNGNPITILRATGNILTTGRIVAMKRRTGFFSINYLREAFFVPGSGVQRGDLIRDETTQEMFFVEGFQNKTRENEVSSINAELYMVNYPSVQIQRKSTTYDASGNPTGTAWTAISTIPANVEHVNGNTPYKDGLLLASTVFKVTMQTTAAVQLLDRFLIDGRGYKADDINLSVISGLQVVQLSIDTR